MALTKVAETGWLDPWRELEEMSKRLARWSGRDLFSADWAPSVDVSETDTEYKIRAALPDVKKEDIHVTLDKGVLTIRGERKHRKEEKNEKLHRVEIASGSFLRSFTMPADADADKVSARYENGVLDVTIGKSEPSKPQARQIQIR